VAITAHDWLEEYHQNLFAWSASHLRAFPWRSLRDPYAVMVAEKLLQQTAATATMSRVYETFLALYPSVHHLSEAIDENLTALLKPLGLAYRAAEMRGLAQYLVSHHNSEVPCTMSELLGLPGVGDYCARAVLSFAYDLDFAVVDTNVGRLLYRLFSLDGPIPVNPARKKSLVALADSLVPRGRSREYNFTILDLCAQICRPTRPKCLQCPILHVCSFENDTKASEATELSSDLSIQARPETSRLNRGT